MATNPPTMHLGAALAAMRDSRRLTQQDVAQHLGVAVGTVSRQERTEDLTLRTSTFKGLLGFLNRHEPFTAEEVTKLSEAAQMPEDAIRRVVAEQGGPRLADPSGRDVLCESLLQELIQKVGRNRALAILAKAIDDTQGREGDDPGGGVRNNIGPRPGAPTDISNWLQTWQPPPNSRPVPHGETRATSGRGRRGTGRHNNLVRPANYNKHKIGYVKHNIRYVKSPCWSSKPLVPCKNQPCETADQTQTINHPNKSGPVRPVTNHRHARLKRG